MKDRTIEDLVGYIQVVAYQIVSSHFYGRATREEMWAALDEDKAQWVEKIRAEIERRRAER